ncbi:polyhydroxyalkanoate synthesis regulator phasin [Hymenobacter luteus]|uniref:Polyhydroxyalkanoate synthesis regulator phasin n=2 Tax=Hymenobacter TaxID=89966 RepID=A0A7W9T3Q2_9BACT|nr:MULTISPECIES: hypothetical protein [Hymenobacter]MBB4603004.1 polyhydroxyalkanoate synthesis regulator phasin [Hymenobacter latericoloratus]MBB6061036.1 polyhydroxyalkanoate synthesis regulator phasin [Hymenobacter luteus]
MEDLFKKFVNAGVGLVSLTNERVQSTIDKLVQDSKLSEQEGARIMDDLKKNTDTKRKELEKQFQGLASRLMKSAGLATNADVEELKRTVKGSSSKAKAGSSAGAGAASAAAKGSSTAAKGPAAAKAAPVKAANTKTSTTSSKAKMAATPESPTGKTSKTAAKKAISPTDTTSNTGS